MATPSTNGVITFKCTIMTQENDFHYVKSKIENEGFHYCFFHYSDFEDEIQDEGFHKLRKIYIEAARNLTKYIDQKIDEMELNQD